MNSKAMPTERTTLRDLAWFRSLKHRDFANGAILDEIEAVFQACEQSRSDHEAMNMLRYCQGDVAMVDDTEGNRFWSADLGTWGEGEASDPAEAIRLAYAVEQKHLRDNPVRMEEK